MRGYYLPSFRNVSLEIKRSRVQALKAIFALRKTLGNPRLGEVYAMSYLNGDSDRKPRKGDDLFVPLGIVNGRHGWGWGEITAINEAEFSAFIEGFSSDYSFARSEFFLVWNNLNEAWYVTRDKGAVG